MEEENIITGSIIKDGKLISSFVISTKFDNNIWSVTLMQDTQYISNKKFKTQKEALKYANNINNSLIKAKNNKK